MTDTESNPDFHLLILNLLYLFSKKVTLEQKEKRIKFASTLCLIKRF